MTKAFNTYGADLTAGEIVSMYGDVLKLAKNNLDMRFQLHGLGFVGVSRAFADEVIRLLAEQKLD